MLSVKTVDVIFRVESSVHNELGLSEAKDIKILKKVFYRLGIGDVPGELAVVKGQSGFLSKNKEQIYLRKLIIILVLAPLDLVKGLGIARDTRTVICPVFIFNTALGLKP